MQSSVSHLEKHLWNFYFWYMVYRQSENGYMFFLIILCITRHDGCFSKWLKNIHITDTLTMWQMRYQRSVTEMQILPAFESVRFWVNLRSKLPNDLFTSFVWKNIVRVWMRLCHRHRSKTSTNHCPKPIQWDV